MQMNIVSLNKKIYNRIAGPFSQTRKFVWDDIKPLIKYAKKDDKILDLGCGTGGLYQLLKDFQYIGIDNSKGQIAEARKSYPNANFKIAEMTGLPFADDEFNIIFCIAAFHHLPDKKTRLQALEEMKRVLRPDGRVVMTNWNLLSNWGKKKLETGNWKLGKDDDIIVPWRNSKREILGERFYHAFTLDELENLFKKAGFEVKENYYSKKGKKSDKREGENIVSVLFYLPVTKHTTAPSHFHPF